MLEQHTSREGVTTLICQMSDEYLMNTIRYFCRRIQQVRQVSEVIEAGDIYSNTLYGLQDIDPETAAEINKMAIQKLYPYLAEAFLRGLDDARQPLIDALDRKGVLKNSQNLLLSDNIDIDF